MISDSNQSFQNSLVVEKSPYLKSHANNPINWQIWDEGAFTEAQYRNVLIFISIGYHSCHGCHVMANEVFEDEQIASFLNDNFVSIKVDREERPDLDSIYLSALQKMGKTGGWPLTIFCTPEGFPIFGGTFFGKKSERAIPAFEEVIKDLNNQWNMQKKKVLKTGRDIASKVVEGQLHFFKLNAKRDQFLNQTSVIQNYLCQNFDSLYGGFLFHQHNKFPAFLIFDYLLLLFDYQRNQELLHMVEYSVEKMIKGGIYDQLEGGLFRYSTDLEWTWPHFEKMLYDNALMMQLLVQLYQLTGKEDYRDWYGEILDFLCQNLWNDYGAFGSSIDADSSGEEGVYYLWSKKELVEILEEYEPVFSSYYGVLEKDPVDKKNVLHVSKSLSDVTKEFFLSYEEVETQLSVAKARLIKARQQRKSPKKDFKINVSWNALIISALAKGAISFDCSKSLELAKKCVETIQSIASVNSVGLFHTFIDGEVTSKPVLSDYATFSNALLDMYHSTLDRKYLKSSKDLVIQAQEIFCDENIFYDSICKDDGLFCRPIDGVDSVEPSGSGMLALVLQRLLGYFELPGFRKSLDQIIRCFYPQMLETVAHPLLAKTLLLEEMGQKQVLVMGKVGDKKADELISVVQKEYRPNVVIVVGDGEDQDLVTKVESAAPQYSVKGVAIVCENNTCQAPIDSPNKLRERLSI